MVEDSGPERQRREMEDHDIFPGSAATVIAAAAILLFSWLYLVVNRTADGDEVARTVTVPPSVHTARK